jgi:tRNA pseudouridine55 synthase
MDPSCSGLVLIDKPAGPTSHDIVAQVRRALLRIRVGHTGTLDPPATGLLVVLLGRATRLARYLPHEPKTYQGQMALGVTTATDDLAGSVQARHAGALPSPGDVAAAAASLTGRRLQTPPVVSAKHVDGKRLYRLARQGRPTEAPAVLVTVDRFTVAPTAEPHLWDYELVVSSGTYVRACVRDLGALLGCGASVASLRRRAIGPWHVDQALPWPDTTATLAASIERHVIGLAEMPLALQSLELLDARAGRTFASGGAVPSPGTGLPDGTSVAVRAAQGELIGIGELAEGSIRPRVVLGDVAHEPPL